MNATAQAGGSDGVLVLWSVVALVVLIGGGLFTYALVINLRSSRNRRGGRDRRGGRGRGPGSRRPVDGERRAEVDRRPPPLPARQVPLPSVPMVGGQPVLTRPDQYPG
jgi:hypothetical protein